MSALPESLYAAGGLPDSARPSKLPKSEIQLDASLSPAPMYCTALPVILERTGLRLLVFGVLTGIRLSCQMENEKESW